MLSDISMVHPFFLVSSTLLNEYITVCLSTYQLIHLAYFTVVLVSKSTDFNRNQNLPILALRLKG